MLIFNLFLFGWTSPLAFALGALGAFAAAFAFAALAAAFAALAGAPAGVALELQGRQLGALCGMWERLE